MIKISAAIAFAMIIKISTVHAQQLSSHQWKDRLLLVLTDDINTQAYLDQIAAFLENEQGLKERKLVVYHITPTAYKIGLKNSSWQASKKLYRTYKETRMPFELFLIGLDGETKLYHTTFTSCKELFNIIDAMPMRRRELDKKKKQN